MRIWTFRIDLGKNAFHLAWSIASAAGQGFACSALVFFRRFGSRILRMGLRRSISTSAFDGCPKLRSRARGVLRLPTSHSEHTPIKGLLKSS